MAPNYPSAFRVAMLCKNTASMKSAPEMLSTFKATIIPLLLPLTGPLDTFEPPPNHHRVIKNPESKEKPSFLNYTLCMNILYNHSQIAAQNENTVVYIAMIESFLGLCHPVVRISRCDRGNVGSIPPRDTFVTVRAAASEASLHTCVKSCPSV